MKQKGKTKDLFSQDFPEGRCHI